MADYTTLEIQQGNDYIIPVQADSDDTNPSFNGWTVTLMAKVSLDDPDTAFKLRKTVQLDAVTGEGEIPLTASETRALPLGYLFYDCRAVNSDGKAGSTEIGKMHIIAVVNQGTT